MDGDRIVKGQILARIDDRDARLRLAAVEGSMAATRAQVNHIEAQRDTADKTTRAQMQQAQLGAAQSALASAGHQLALARTNFQCDDSMVKGGGTLRKIWDESRTLLL